MLAQALHWLWILLVTSGFGSLVVPPSLAGETPFARLWLKSVGGLALLIGASLLLNFWLPLNAPLAWVVGVVGLGLGIKNKVWIDVPSVVKGWSVWVWVCVGLVGAGCLIKAAAPNSTPDMGLYYIQTMRWAEHYAVVPGLANIHSRLGFNSCWYLAVVLLNPLASQIALDGLNEYLLLGSLTYFFFDRFGRKGQKVATGLWLAGGLSFYIATFWLIDYISCPMADLAIAILMWHLVDVLLPLAKNGNLDDSLQRFRLALLLACIIFTIKISGLPALALVGAVALAQAKPWPLLRLLWIPTLLLTAWVVRCYILTGYPLFPVPMALPDALVPDWQVPGAYTQHTFTDIKGFARFRIKNPADEPSLSYEVLAKMSLKEWLPYWIKEKTSVDWRVLGALFIGMVAFVYQMLRGRYTRGELFLGGALLVGVVYWFFTAPGVRFAVCYVAPFAWLAAIAGGKPRFIPNPIPLASWGGIAGLFLFLCLDIRSIRTYALLPAPWGKTQTAKSANGPYTYPITRFGGNALDECWDAPLPCGENGNLKVKLRGKTLQEGFAPVR